MCSWACLSHFCSSFPFSWCFWIVLFGLLLSALHRQVSSGLLIHFLLLRSLRCAFAMRREMHFAFLRMPQYDVYKGQICGCRKPTWYVGRIYWLSSWFALHMLRVAGTHPYHLLSEQRMEAWLLHGYQSSYHLVSTMDDQESGNDPLLPVFGVFWRHFPVQTESWHKLDWIWDWLCQLATMWGSNEPIWVGVCIFCVSICIIFVWRTCKVPLSPYVDCSCPSPGYYRLAEGHRRCMWEAQEQVPGLSFPQTHFWRYSTSWAHPRMDS